MTAPLLEVDGLVKHFVATRTAFGKPSSLVRAVDGVSFSVAAGETLALVGESGCGKSTIGRLVLRLIDATAGTVRFDGQDISALAGAELQKLRASAQLIFQDPYASLNPRMTVGDMLAEPLFLHTRLPTTARRERVAELLTEVGLKPIHAHRYAHEFSGGQRQRVAIARALAVSPKLLVCDEPVSALDVSIRAQILNLLRDLQERLGLAMVFISHDLSVVKHIANRVAVMYLGRIVEMAETDELFANPRHPYTQALLSAIPVPSPDVRRERRVLAGDPPSPINPPAGCHLHPRCPHASARCGQEVPALGSDQNAHVTACHRWQEIGQSGFTPPQEALFTPTMRRLLDAYRDGR